MIDNFAILITHGLMLLTCWLLLKLPDLDSETPPKPNMRRRD